ncbi:hypothetical protein DFP72DRAFT_1059529 [Ephemerocybe angulata]|uniref:F-box domain-containing protein n=1 Tax=Ephemerocybe angulata TaxID=980116 RepID=A0A8H6II22_9AGAR|nr:hypothetical protein DFP72DRAFT_1059529 [Tulosesus angulatus]
MSALSDTTKALASLELELPKRQARHGDEVPTDVWMEILFCLYCKDLLSMSLVCKSLNDLVGQKKVWIENLRSFCKREAVFFPSYPVDDMDVRDLQRATLGPERLRTLFRENSAAVYDRNTPVMAPATATILSDHPGARFILSKGLFLVPGGRFLVAANQLYLGLYDLGPAGREPRPLEEGCILAQEIYHADMNGRDAMEYELGQLSVVPHKETGLRIAVALCNRSTIVVKMYEISFPCAPNTPFIQLGTLCIGMPLVIPESEMDDHLFMLGNYCDSLLIDGDWVHLEVKTPTGETSVVWNFVDRKCGFGPDSHRPPPSANTRRLGALHEEKATVILRGANIISAHFGTSPPSVEALSLSLAGAVDIPTGPLSVSGGYGLLKSHRSGTPANSVTEAQGDRNPNRPDRDQSLAPSNWYQSHRDLPLYYDVLQGLGLVMTFGGPVMPRHAHLSTFQLTGGYDDDAISDMDVRLLPIARHSRYTFQEPGMGMVVTAHPGAIPARKAHDPCIVSIRFFPDFSQEGPSLALLCSPGLGSGELSADEGSSEAHPQEPESGRIVFLHRGAPHQNTNADRMRRGLPPLEPRRLYSPTTRVRRGALPSSVPVITATFSIYTKDASFAGYFNRDGTVTSTLGSDSSFKFTNPATASQKFELISASNPSLRTGLTTGVDGPAFVGDGSYNHLTPIITSYSTPAGTPPKADVEPTRFETTVVPSQTPGVQELDLVRFSINPNTGVLSAKWINESWSAVGVSWVMKTYLGVSSIVAVGDLSAYKYWLEANFPGSTVVEVTLIANPE